MALTGTVSSKSPCRSMDSSAMRRRRHAGMKSPGRDDTERDETRQHQQLDDGKRRFGSGRRERPQEWTLREGLHDRHEYIQVKGRERTRHVDPAPGPGQPVTVERDERNRENDERNDANHVRGAEALRVKEEAGDARGDRRDQKDCGPARQPLRAPQADGDHRAASNGDQADHHVDKGKGLGGHSQDHGPDYAPSIRVGPSPDSWTRAAIGRVRTAADGASHRVQPKTPVAPLRSKPAGRNSRGRPCASTRFSGAAQPAITLNPVSSASQKSVPSHALARLSRIGTGTSLTRTRGTG